MASALRVWLATGPCKEELTTSWGLHRGGHPGLQALLGSGGQGFLGEGGVALPLPRPPLSPRGCTYSIPSSVP